MSIVDSKNTLHAIEGATPNSHSLANPQERIRNASNIARKKFLYTFDLVVRDRNGLSAHVDESCNTSREQNKSSHLRTHNRVYEKVARKKRDFDSLPSIAPAMNFRKCGIEGRYALIPQLVCDKPFVPRHCLNRVPVRDFGLDRRLDLISETREATHSFALWVTVTPI
jgi:hypothetical protein